MTTPGGPPQKGPALAGKKRRQQLLIGGSLAGGVVVIALYKRSQNAAAAGSATPGSTATGATMTGTATPYSYQGGYGDYSSQLGAMQQQLAQLTAMQNPAPAGSSPTAPTSSIPTTSQVTSPGPVNNDMAVTALGPNYGGPNVKGLPLAAAFQQLQAAGYRVTNVSGSGGSVYSFTPYSNGAVRIGTN